MSAERPVLSAVILTFDEEVNITRAVSGALRLTPDVVVVDSGSRDRTAELARQAGARVVFHPWPGTAAQRNWALTEAGLGGTWALFLDADESVSPEFAEGLLRLLRERPELDGVSICRRFHWWGRWVPAASAFPCYIDRVVRIGTVRFRVLGHGEVFDGGRRFARLDSALHDEDLKPLDAWLSRHIRYARHEAESELARADRGIKRDRRLRLRSRLRRIPGWPVLALAYYLFWRRGLLDGPQGRTYCVMKAMYEYMVQLHMRDLRYRRSRNLPIAQRRD